MSKVYLVSESWGTCDDSSYVGAFLDEKQANDYITEHRKPREADEKQHERCRKCRRCDSKNYGDRNEYFDLRNQCDKAIIKKDRNGKYCENDLSEYYSISSNDYWKTEVELLDVNNGEELKDNWDNTSKVISKVISRLKQSINDIKDLDDVLTELQKIQKQ